MPVYKLKLKKEGCQRNEDVLTKHVYIRVF
jgi:hypothetical protein